MAKKNSLLLGLMMLLSVALFAQPIRKQSVATNSQQQYQTSNRQVTPSRSTEIGAMYGFMFGGRKGNFDIDNTEAWNLSLSFPMSWHSRVELSWHGQNTAIGYKGFFTGNDYINTNVNYYQVGFVKEMPHGKNIPYIVTSLGASQISPENTRLQSYEDVWEFAVTLGAGFKHYISDKVGIKIEARMLAPISFGGMYFNIGTGGSSGIGLNSGSAYVQGYIAGGLVFALGK
ncbi:MAG: hypothetical protein KAG96_01055 [Ichthyobacteriaceae bacterium]|nr:hypothetical protein [Ichthyobacteriaceae bacterium]